MASTRIGAEERYAGAQVAVLENENLRVKVVPEKGSDIVEIVYKKRNLNLLYESPIGFRRFGAVSAPSVTADSSFLDFYEGGWQDIVPNPGLVSSNRGASWGMHGESSLLPWSAAVADDGDRARLKVSTTLMRYPLRIEKTLTLSEGSSVLKVDEVLTNLGEQDIEFAWLQHIVFGRPMVGPGMSVDMRAGACTAGAYKQTRLKSGIRVRLAQSSGLRRLGHRHERRPADGLEVRGQPLRDNEGTVVCDSELAGGAHGGGLVGPGRTPLALVLAEQRGGGLPLVGAVVQPGARTFQQRDGVGHTGVHGEGKRPQAP